VCVCKSFFGETTRGCSASERSHAPIHENRNENRNLPSNISVFFSGLPFIIIDFLVFSLSVSLSKFMTFWLAYRLVCVCTFLFRETTRGSSTSERSHALIVENRHENRRLPSNISVFSSGLPFIITDFFVFPLSVWFSKLMKFWLSYCLVCGCTIFFGETRRSCSASERTHALINHNRNEKKAFCEYLSILFSIIFYYHRFFAFLIISVIQQVDEVLIRVSVRLCMHNFVSRNNTGVPGKRTKSCPNRWEP